MYLLEDAAQSLIRPIFPVFGAFVPVSITRPVCLFKALFKRLTIDPQTTMSVLLPIWLFETLGGHLGGHLGGQNFGSLKTKSTR